MENKMDMFSYDRYETTCKLLENANKKYSIGTLMRVELCDVQFMMKYFDVLCACFHDQKREDIKKTLELNAYMITDTGRVPLRIGQVISIKEYARYKIHRIGLEAQTGARPFYKIMQHATLTSIIESHKAEISELENSYDPAADEKIEYLNECIETIKEFKSLAPKDTPLCMFRTSFLIKVDSYNKETKTICVKSGGIDEAMMKVVRKNQFLYNNLEANSGSVMITQAREALKSAFDEIPFSMPITDDVTDIAIYSALLKVK